MPPVPALGDAAPELPPLLNSGGSTCKKQPLGFTLYGVRPSQRVLPGPITMPPVALPPLALPAVAAPALVEPAVVAPPVAALPVVVPAPPAAPPAPPPVA